jgi:hypothetical protein
MNVRQVEAERENKRIVRRIKALYRSWSIPCGLYRK